MTEKNNLKPGWKKGQSGNPRGKPKGKRHAATLLAVSILEADIEAIARTVTAAAKGGDLAACRMVLERLIPVTKERTIRIDLPDTTTAAGINAAQYAILSAVGAGEILPGEGATLASIVETRRKALETQELEQRISALEGKTK